MPGISANARATPRITIERPRLQPPGALSDEGKAEFTAIVEACSPEHFCRSDLPLLTSYGGAIVLSRKALKDAFEDKDALNIWEKSTRLIAMLASRLRLAPVSRTDPKTIARNSPKPNRPRPWER